MQTINSNTCLVYVWFTIHYKLICSYLCSTEQNNKASLKSNNERFILMTKSRLVSEWEKFLGVSQVAAVLQVAAVIFGKDCQCWSIPWWATGERSFFSACRVLFVLLADFQKGLEKIVLYRKMELVHSAHWLVSVWPNCLAGEHWFVRENRSVTATLETI